MSVLRQFSLKQWHRIYTILKHKIYLSVKTTCYGMDGSFAKTSVVCDNRSSSVVPGGGSARDLFSGSGFIHKEYIMSPL